MQSFVDFVQTYAIWLYLLSALGILLGIKLFADARRLARTTLYSLDLERANDQTLRALSLIGMLLLTMVGVTAVNGILGPLSPGVEPPVLRGATPTFSAMVFPSFTPVASATATLIRPTETAFYTPTPVTPTSTRPPVSITATRLAIMPATSIPTPAVALPPPMLKTPRNGYMAQGEGQANAALTFSWDWCSTCVLSPEDRYVLVITFVDKNTGNAKSVSDQLRENSITMKSLMRGGTEIYQQGRDDAYQWYVQVKRGAINVTPPSETWKFVWH